MALEKQKLRARKPTLDEARGPRRLLVWGELAQWLVVDAELDELLRALDGRRSLRSVLKDHARRRGRPYEHVAREARPVIRHLVERGILTERGRESAAAEAGPIRIANLTINLTNRCNLRCHWCYNAGRTTEEMPIPAIMDAVAADRSIFDRAASCIILGGEPFLDPPRLWTALDRMGELFTVSPMVSTNGTLLTDRTVGELARRTAEVQVSLDSHDPERHDAVRGPGTHAAAVRGIRRLVAAGVHTIMSMIYTARNLDGLEPYLDLARELGVAEARFIPLRLIGGGRRVPEARPDQFAALTALLAVLDRRPGLRPLLGRDFFSIITAVCRYSFRRVNCGIGRRVIFIDADGAVYPCPNHVAPAFRAGTLRERGLAELVRASPVMKDVRARYHVAAYTRCRSCPFRHWCAGDCRGEVLALTGDPTAPSPHCEELRRVYTEILWLIAEKDPRLGLHAEEPEGRSTADTWL
jgi:radical SAM protein with 4Fe4S-binding SPASM domain